ncbi:helix-turn-helix domain-containing protein [Streptococcus pluranimalium]
MKDKERIIGNRIKNIRLGLGLTQEKFGELFNAGKGLVSRWENGLSFPSPERVKKMAQISNVPVSYLLKENIMSDGDFTDILMNSDDGMYVNGYQNRIKELREFLNLSLDELASSLGIDKSELLTMEEQHGFIKLETVKKLVKILDFPAQEILGYTDKYAKTFFNNIESPKTDTDIKVDLLSATKKSEIAIEEAFENANSFFETQINSIKEITELLIIGIENETLATNEMLEGLKLVKENIESIDETVNKMIEFQSKYTAGQILKSRLENIVNKSKE